MMKNFGSSIYVYEFYEFVILFMYKNAKEVRERHNTQHQTPQNSVWTRPSEGYLKCNVDASFSKTRNKVGINVCIRDDQDQFVLAKTK
jgi:hypothetical protein